MTKRSEKRTDSVRSIKPKFAEERIQNIKPIKPLNPMQAQYMEYIRTKNLIIATGFPGVSKSWMPTAMACDMWRLGEIDKIYLTRPNISNSKSLGYFSGSLIDKMMNWLMPVLDVMYDRLGREVVEIAIKSGDISFIPLETIKGMSFGPRTFVIGEEMSDCTIAEAQILVLRQGGGTMVLSGDIEQSALSEKSGLAYLRKVVECSPNLEKHVGFVDFNRTSDIVRSDECREWVIALRNFKE